MKEKKQVSIPVQFDGFRLDLALTELWKLTRSQVQKSIKFGEIFIDGAPAKKVGQVVREGNIVRFEPKDALTTENTVAPKLDVIFETDEYIVVNKPAGMLVHPTQAQETGTLAHALVHYYPAIASVGDSPVRPGIVHRLDKEASGVLVVAKTQEMFDHLKHQFKKRTVEKFYTVLVHEFMDKDHDDITFAIDRGSAGKMVSRPHLHEITLETVHALQEGKPAHTEYWVLERLVRYSLLKVRIHSGRTHQIRVHMFAYGHPVVGDTIYKNKKIVKNRDLSLSRLFLHASTLGFETLSGERVEYTSTLPEELTKFLTGLQS